ncbi:MAG: ClpX C4-type zinc finger protein [Myxococcota bacterium]
MRCLPGETGDLMTTPTGPALTCSFCGKGQKEVAKLIAGPAVYICNECIRLCNSIIISEGKVVERATGQDPLDGFVDDNAARSHAAQRISAVVQANGDLASLASDAAFFLRSTLLLTGPTGTGKTFLLHQLAGCARVPVLHLSAASLVATGFRGVNVGTALGSWATSVADKLNRGIVIIDDVEALLPESNADKRALQEPPSRPPERQELQAELAHFMDRETVGVPGKYGASQVELDISWVTIIFAGRLDIGAGDDWRQRLIASGMNAGLAARISEHVHLPALDEAQLTAVLTEGPASMLEVAKAAATVLGVELQVAEQRVKAEVSRAFRSGRGAWELAAFVRQIWRTLPRKRSSEEPMKHVVE